MNGLVLLPSEPISEEAKAKLKKMMEKREERLRRMVEEYKSGKFDDIIKSL
jgi:hypothetical protein